MHLLPNFVINFECCLTENLLFPKSKCIKQCISVISFLSVIYFFKYTINFVTHSRFSKYFDSDNLKKQATSSCFRNYFSMANLSYFRLAFSLAEFGNRSNSVWQSLLMLFTNNEYCCNYAKKNTLRLLSGKNILTIFSASKRTCDCYGRVTITRVNTVINFYLKCPPPLFFLPFFLLNRNVFHSNYTKFL